MMSPAEPLRVLREAKVPTATPLVFVHPVAGDSAVYAPLAERLAWSGVVIGIDATTTWPTLRELAAHHVQLIRAAAPGPWCLAGWSVGGVIAAEMAAQLAEASTAVAGLAIFDARAPVPEMKNRPTDDATLARNFVEMMSRRVGREATRHPTRADAGELLDILRESGSAPPGWDASVAASRFAIFAGIVRAFFGHDQRRIDAPMALFEARDAHPQHPKPPTLGWEQHARTVVRADIPGTHFTLMLEQHAPELARIVDDVLSRLVAG